MAKQFFDFKKNRRERNSKTGGVKEFREKSVKLRTAAEDKIEKRYNEFLKTLSPKYSLLQRGAQTKTGALKEESGTETKARSWLLKLMLWLIVPIGLAAFVYFGADFISRVEITLEIQKETRENVFSVLLREKPTQTGFFNDLLTLPLYSFQKYFSYSQDYPATGEGEAKSYSRGKIIIYNEATQTPQILVAKTRFESSDGKIFRIQERVVLPGYNQFGPGKLEAEVIADQPGPEYNLGPTRFTLPGFAGSEKFEKIYAVSKEKFSGGISGLTKIVTQEDINIAKEKIAQFAYETARAEIIKEMPENLKLMDRAIQFNPGKITTSSVGDAEKTKAEIKGSLSVFVFDENELKQFIEEKMSETQQVKGELSQANYQIFYENPEVDLENKTMRLKIRVKRDIQALVDTLEFKQKIAGKSLVELRKELLRLEGVKKIKVVVWPFWVSRAPLNLEAIKVRVE